MQSSSSVFDVRFHKKEKKKKETFPTFGCAFDNYMTNFQKSEYTLPSPHLYQQDDKT